VTLSNDRYDLTVIVIGWQVRNELGRCLESVRRNTGSLSVQTIYVDNASTDGSAEFVAETFPEVTIVRLTKNEGLPARNHGLRLAQGRHRMFLDSDAELTPAGAERLVSRLDSSPGTGLVGPRINNPDGSLQLSVRRYPPLALPVMRRPPLGRFFENGPTIRRHLMADDPPTTRRRVEYVLGACQVFRKEAQDAVGEIDPRIWFGHDDADWCFRIRRAGFTVEYVPDAIVTHAYRRSTAAKPWTLVSLRFLIAHLYCQLKWLPGRRSLRAEGKAMDREAVAVVERKAAA
jgi:GT2 family glycosyltransferase